MLRRMRTRSALTVMISTFLFVSSLWQIEMLWVQFQNREIWELDAFALPFGYEVSWYVARDLFYLMLFISWFVLICTGLPDAQAS